VLKQTQKSIRKIQNPISDRTATQPSLQRRLTRYPNLESTFPRWPRHLRPKVPSHRMGPTHGSSNINSQSPPFLPTTAQTLGPRSLIWQLQLQRNSPGTTWHTSYSTQDTRTTCHLCASWHRRLVHRPFAKSLLLLPVISPKHRERPTRPNSRLVPQYHPFPSSNQH
jgi:hypothetical protein